MLKRIMSSITAAVVAAVTVFVIAPEPAGAVTPLTAQSVAYASLGSARWAAWLQNGTVYAQQLGSDGQPVGTARVVHRPVEQDDVDTELGPEVTLAMSPGGIAVGMPANHYFDQTGTKTQFSGVIFFVYDAQWRLRGTTTTCNGEEVEELEPIGSFRSGTAVWSGSNVLVASDCLKVSNQPALLDLRIYDAGMDLLVIQRPQGRIATPQAGVAGGTFGVAYQRIGPTGDLDVNAVQLTTAGPVGGVVTVAGGTGDQFAPTIAGSGSSFLVGWTEGADRNIAGRTWAAGRLGPKKVLVAAPKAQNRPRLATAPNGGWHLAWTDLRAGTNDVFAARVTSALQVKPPGGQVVANGAGAQQKPSLTTRPGGAASVAYLDGAAPYYRDLTAGSVPVGPPVRFQYNPVLG